MRNRYFLIDKYINDLYSYHIEQLSRYNDYDGKKFWKISFESLSKVVLDLKSKYQNYYESNFHYLEFTLNKINELGQKPNSNTNEELIIFIDYFELKLLDLLEDIDSNTEISS